MNKPFWKSKTFWSDVLTALMAAYVALSSDGFVPEIPPNTLAAALGIAALFGIQGRAQAKGKLTL